eukprot:m.221614 g.221614  ORF g.221614 m.221614 type:complete len:178 (-) comp71853_c0_seq1:102-635(-)
MLHILGPFLPPGLANELVNCIWEDRYDGDVFDFRTMAKLLTQTADLHDEWQRQCLDLLAGLLAADDYKRLTSTQALAHPLMREDKLDERPPEAAVSTTAAPPSHVEDHSTAMSAEIGLLDSASADASDSPDTAAAAAATAAGVRPVNKVVASGDSPATLCASTVDRRPRKALADVNG